MLDAASNQWGGRFTMSADFLSLVIRVSRPLTVLKRFVLNNKAWCSVVVVFLLLLLLLLLLLFVLFCWGFFCFVLFCFLYVSYVICGCNVQEVSGLLH